VEQAASPLTAFLISPVAQFVAIPVMTTGAGVELIGGWFGVGPERGLALVFTVTGLIGLVVTLLALRTRFYRALSRRYLEAPAVVAAGAHTECGSDQAAAPSCAGCPLERRPRTTGRRCRGAVNGPRGVDQERRWSVRPSGGVARRAAPRSRLIRPIAGPTPF
jgi:hypothetical protein